MYPLPGAPRPRTSETAEQRRARTAPAREAQWQRLLHQVDPDGMLPLPLREALAHSARREMLAAAAAAAKRRPRAQP